MSQSHHNLVPRLRQIRSLSDWPIPLKRLWLGTLLSAVIGPLSLASAQAQTLEPQSAGDAIAQADSTPSPLSTSSLSPLQSAGEANAPYEAIAPSDLPRPSSAPQIAQTSPALNPYLLNPPVLNPLPQSQDPAEQVAPAGIPVELNNQPITPIETVVMREELQELIGRFESALLSANAAGATINVQVPNELRANDSTLVASADPSRTSVETLAAGPAINHPAIRQARDILEEFPRLIERGQYLAARQRWLQARQILWDSFPSDRPLAQAEVRAMWLDRGTIVAARSRQGLERLFDQLQDAGINTVFFETVNAGYTIYPSQVAPSQNPLTRGWDPLADAVDLAHERNMELHAWVWTFAAGNTRHNPLVNEPETYPGPLIAANPDWANYDNRGSMIPLGQTKPFLDPANPSVRRYLLRLFEEIVTRYDVDGLQLDYIRYPFQDPSAGRTYGYGRVARERFQQMTGVDPTAITPSDRRLWEQWTAFRTQQVDSFVADTSTLLRRIKPSLILSTAVFPISEHERIQKIQQHWELWAQRGDVDVIVTMSYAMDTNRLQRLVMPWLDHADALGPVLVLPSIRLLNLPNANAFQQIQAIRDMPSGGYSLFAVADLNDTLQVMFSRTQGSSYATRPEPIPYRQPFQTVVARYESLQREWSVMLANGELRVWNSQQTIWNTQTAALDQALRALASNPSEQRLNTAKRLLHDFRTQFDDWVSLQSNNDDYRLRTWNNRLEAMDTLLNYGNHFVLQRQARR